MGALQISEVKEALAPLIQGLEVGDKKRKAAVQRASLLDYASL
jgi:hypothetical protein